jgi:hypothetical protein
LSSEKWTGTSGHAARLALVFDGGRTESDGAVVSLHFRDRWNTLARQSSGVNLLEILERFLGAIEDLLGDWTAGLATNHY